MRILVALEHDYRAYRDMIAAALQVLCRGAKVESASLEALEEHIERFDPHLLICSQSTTVELGSRLACVELSLDPLRPSKMWIAGRYSKRTNLTLDEMLEVIDEVEEVIQTTNN